jgi:hypothetical protein
MIRLLVFTPEQTKILQDILDKIDSEIPQPQIKKNIISKFKDKLLRIK